MLSRQTSGAGLKHLPRAPDGQARWAPGRPLLTTKEASTTARDVVSAAEATVR